MKHSFAKLLVLMMVLALVLTGCNLINVDVVEQVAEQRTALEKKYQGAILATYDGGEVTQEDVMGAFTSTYSTYAQYYAYFGMTIDQNTTYNILSSSIENEILMRLVAEDFEARGLEIDHTDEEIAEEVDTTYQTNYDYIFGTAEGATDEERAANTEYALYANGMTREYIEDYTVKSLKYEAWQEAVAAEVTEVTDEELQAAYDEEVADDEATYSENPALFDTAVTSDTEIVAWRPEGVRTVKHVLILVDEEPLTAVTDARNALAAAQTAITALEDELAALTDDDAADEEARTEDEINADLEAANAELPALEQAVADAEAACLASVQGDIDAVYARLAEEGVTFDQVMEEMGNDPGMTVEPAKTTGYYVSAASTVWDANFTAEAMSLAAVGDYSAQPVISTSGVHIVYYASDVPAGAVPMDEIHDALYEQTLAAKKADYVTAATEAMLAAVNPVQHIENFVVE
ncbi:MAG: peptidylprolyl isomerase [Clostridia bacterium]|nr:peptidylprolyl isomerase [Clostridia bacterium]